MASLRSLLFHPTGRVLHARSFLKPTSLLLRLHAEPSPVSRRKSRPPLPPTQRRPASSCPRLPCPPPVGFEVAPSRPSRAERSFCALSSPAQVLPVCSVPAFLPSGRSPPVPAPRAPRPGSCWSGCGGGPSYPEAARIRELTPEISSCAPRLIWSRRLFPGKTLSVKEAECSLAYSGAGFSLLR